MNEQDLRTLIENAIIKEIAGLIVQKLTQGPKDAWVLFTGAMLGFEQALDSLKALKETTKFRVLLSERAAAIMDQNQLREALNPESIDIATPEKELLVMKEPGDIIFVPALSTRSASVLASLMADTPLTRIIQNAFMRGQKVAASIDGCCPECWAERGYTMAPALEAQMIANLTKLKSYGIILSRAAKLSRKASQPIAEQNTGAAIKSSIQSSERVIGAQSVASCPPNSSLRVGKGALITQLARDMARSKGVTIEIL